VLHVFLWSNDFSSRSPSVLGRVGKSWMSTRRTCTISSKLFGIGDLCSPQRLTYGLGWVSIHKSTPLTSVPRPIFEDFPGHVT